MAKYFVTSGDREFAIEIEQGREGMTVKLSEDGSAQVAVDYAVVNSVPTTGEGLYSIIADGESFQVYVVPTEDGYRVVMWRHRFDLAVKSEREWRLNKVAPRQSLQSGKMVIKSPMPGLIKALLVHEGDEVSAGQRLLVLEAMKMENEIASSRPGRVTGVHVSAGTVVDGGVPLITVE